MRPKVIVHNTVSVDGSVSGFEIDMPLHYQLAGFIGPDAKLIGADTLVTGIQTFEPEAPPETAADRRPRDWSAGDTPPLWVITDSRGKLRDQIHVLRRSEYVGPLLILVADTTPQDYIAYLDQRGVGHHRVGADRVDLAAALDHLALDHGVASVMVDAGPALIGALMDRGLVDELSLVVTPRAVGRGGRVQLGELSTACALDLEQCQTLDGGVLHLRYRVGNRR